MKVGIIGTGLIGGSMARALYEHGVELYLDETDPDTVSEIERERIGYVASYPEWVGHVDSVMVAVPLTEAVSIIHGVVPLLSPEAWLVEGSSVKGPILDALRWAAERVNVASLHFMAGREVGGWVNASPTLFHGAPAAAVDTGSGFPPKDWLEWWQIRLGTAPFSYWTPAQHDAAMAWMSQLPYLASRAVRLVVEAHAPEAQVLAGPGFNDTVRVGRAAWKSVTPMFEAHPQELGRALLALESQIRRWRECLNLPDAGSLGDCEGREEL